jgi:hypothetical protein
MLGARQHCRLLAYSTALIPVALAAIAKWGLPFDPVNAR